MDAAWDPKDAPLGLEGVCKEPLGECNGPMRSMLREPLRGTSLLGGSWYLVANNYFCAGICAHNHIRALEGLISGLQVQP